VLYGLSALVCSMCGFSKPPPVNRKMNKGQLHSRSNLAGVAELPLETPEPEPVPKEPLPPHRVPYTLHVSRACRTTGTSRRLAIPRR